MSKCFPTVSVDHPKRQNFTLEQSTFSFSNAPTIDYQLCVPDKQDMLLLSRETDNFVCSMESILIHGAIRWILIFIIFLFFLILPKLVFQMFCVLNWKILCEKKIEFIGFCDFDGNLIDNKNLNNAITSLTRKQKIKKYFLFTGALCIFGVVLGAVLYIISIEY